MINQLSTKSNTTKSTKTKSNRTKNGRVLNKCVNGLIKTFPRQTEPCDFFPISPNSLGLFKF